MQTLTVDDGATPFEVTLFEAAAPTRVVLFAAGRGGNPGRHLPLLETLAASGCSVIAPRFDMMAPVPGDAELEERGRRLGLSLDRFGSPGVAIAGVGHSVGAALLLGLAGARLWTRSGRPAQLPRSAGLDRLVLLAPAVDFVRPPGALDEVRASVLAYAGTADTVVPPSAVKLVTEALKVRAPAELRVMDDAGHFSFMNIPPPHAPEPLADREAFLANLAAETASFVAR